MNTTSQAALSPYLDPHIGAPPIKEVQTWKQNLIDELEGLLEYEDTFDVLDMMLNRDTMEIDRYIISTDEPNETIKALNGKLSDMATAMFAINDSIKAAIDAARKL